MRSLLTLFLFSVFLLDSIQVFAQRQKHTIGGTVKDKETGETLIGATIRFQSMPSTGTVTNEYGYNHEYHVNEENGLVSAKLNEEGPIQKGKSSFLLSDRRTYGDVFLKLIDVEVISDSSHFLSSHPMENVKARREVKSAKGQSTLSSQQADTSLVKMENYGKSLKDKEANPAPILLLEKVTISPLWIILIFLLILALVIHKAGNFLLKDKRKKK